MMNSKQVKWVGHRGFRGPFAQNTIPAFVEGAKRGCYALECDVRVSSDDVFYICHDDVFLEYLFTETAPINQLMGPFTWKELQKYELHGPYLGQEYRGSKLASFEEYLKVCKSFHCKAVIELKWTKGLNPNDTSHTQNLITLVEKHGMLEDAIFMSSMRDVLLAIRNHDPQATIQLLTGVKTTTLEVAQWCCEHRFSIDALASRITPEIVSLMHEHQLLVNAWTVNDQETADQLIKLGVDMITSDVLC